jgi:hypothetical protein
MFKLALGSLQPSVRRTLQAVSRKVKLQGLEADHSPQSSADVVRAIADAVSRWLPTAEARVQFRIWSSGIYGGQSGAGAGFLRVLRFPLPFIPPNSPSSQSPGAGTIGQ